MTAASTEPTTDADGTVQADTVLLARVRLRLTSPASIAAPERAAADPGDPLAAAASLPVARDGWGAPYIPASSLAGALRAHLANTEPGLVEALMGSEPSERGETRDQQPSALRFLGTEATPPTPASDNAHPAAPITQLRGRTATDRRRAAPATATLRTHELLPAGTEITLYLRLDGNDTALHGVLLAALDRWCPHVGGGRTIGLGHTEPIEIRHGTLDLAHEHGLRLWLTLGGPELVNTVARTIRPPVSASAPEAWLRVPWHIVDALHIGTGETTRTGTGTREPDGSADAEPGTGRAAAYAPVFRNGATPCVPGATWKGLLRARCEFILRSVGLLAVAPGDAASAGGAPSCDASKHGGTCGRCVVCDAFGWSGEANLEDGATHEQAADTPVAARGRLAFADSPIADAVCVVRNHTALDRIFGGVAQGLLFAQEVVETGTLDLTVHDDPQRPLADPELVKALLVLACHEINDGYLGVGGATTRGHGTLAFGHPHYPQAGHAGGVDETDREYAMLVLAERRDRGPHGALIAPTGER